MATDDRTGTGARVFTVRLWKEDLTDRGEYRGSVRDVRSDAFIGFRDWTEMVAFMVARLEEHASARADVPPIRGGTA